MEKLIFLPDMAMVGLNIPNKDELLKYLAEYVKNKSLVSEEYITALIKREKEFPTGLQTFIPIALPHVGIGVFKPFLVVATLEEPVVFYDMGEIDKKVLVDIVVLFGIKNPNDQAEVLQNFSSILQDESNLKRIKNSKNSQELYDFLVTLIY